METRYLRARGAVINIEVEGAYISELYPGDSFSLSLLTTRQRALLSLTRIRLNVPRRRNGDHQRKHESESKHGDDVVGESRCRDRRASVSRDRRPSGFLRCANYQRK